MVDVSAKAETVREAHAEAIVTMSKETLAMIVEGKHHKGDVFLLRLVLRYSSCKTYLGAYPALPSVVTFKVEVNLEPLFETNQVRIQSLCKLTGKLA